ncbi:MAG: sigma-70 family RNA polymerase sigma factor [Ginsengibacter sp.]
MNKKEKFVTNYKMNVSNPHQWVENYADYLYGFAFSRINDEEQSRDLVQETLLAALESIKKFEGRSSEKTWLTSILKYKIYDIYREKTASVRNVTLHEAYPRYFDQADGEWQMEHKPTEFSIKDENAVESKEFYRILKLCLNKLPASWITAFKMKFMEEEETKDICNELQITSTNYWVIIHRAKINLRACLQKHWL